MHEEDVILHSEVSMTALVADASSDVGTQFCRQLASMGFNIILISNQMTSLAALRDSLAVTYPNLRFWAHFKDLADPDAADQIFQFCSANAIVVDVLVNNACIYDIEDFCQTTSLRLNAFIDLNVRTSTLLCHLFATEMKRRGQGYILNVTSVSSWLHLPGIGMYAASMAYLRVLSQSLQLELIGSGVTVTVACPGGIATDLFRLPKNFVKWGLRLRVLSTPDHFVKGALNFMFNHKKQYFNGIINRLAIAVIFALPYRIKLLLKHKLLDRNVSK